MTSTQFLVRKDQLPMTRLRELPDLALKGGQVRVAIAKFALTSNNITYAAFGEAMNYWAFYPSGEDGWGIVPVWGFGDVVQSTHVGVAVGERLYGYFPMAGSVVLEPVRLSPAGFVDGAPHRAPSTPSTTSTCAAPATLSTATKPKTCRHCCAHCS